MELDDEDHCYYGRMTTEKPAISFSDEMVRDQEKGMMELMREMEERLKRHITECKREIIRALRPDAPKKPPRSKKTKSEK